MLDVANFEDALTAGNLEHALDLYQGNFREEFYVDSDSFEEWVRLERERLRFR